MVYENMTQKKVRWKCIISCCYRTEIPLLEESEDPVLKHSSCRRLSLSDLSNPSSPLYVQDLSNSFLGSNLHVFTFTELRVITRGFLGSNLLGEGGFGPVYKGFIDDKVRPGLEAQPVAVKSLDLEGVQGHREWMAEIVFLGQLRHPHLVKLIGYCCEEDQRLLVYEYMPRGSLENQLFRRYSASLKWSIRMKIALGAAKGLAFLHEADPPVIYRDFKTSNILLDSDFTAKLSDFGLAKDGPEGEETHVTTRVMGTQGYAAPEYIKTGHLTTMSDVYSFGVVLLELLTGQRSMDHTRPRRAQSLVDSARPHLKDPNKLDRIIDPRLDGEFQGDAALKAAALAYKCLNYHPKTRPSMSYVVNILESLQDQDCGDILAEPIVYLVGEENGGEECFGREEGIKSEGQKDSSTESIPQNLKRHRHHGWRNRIKLPNPVVSFSDTTLYEGFSNGLNSPDTGKRRNR